MSAPTDPIEAYLDQLLARLGGRARDVRRILAETEDHLRQSVEEAMAAGLSEEEAAREAVARFGSPATVARRFAAGSGWLPSRRTVVELFMAAVLLGGIGFTAIGASGLVAQGMGTALGKGFVSGSGPYTRYPANRCADFQEYHPRPTCEQAATAHHFDEVVTYREAAGILGLIALGVYAVAGRRRGGGSVPLLPDGFVATLGAALFGAAALVMLGSCLNQVLAGSSAGVGELLSGGAVSALVAAAFTVELLRTLRLRAEVAPG